jgi:hypothetical protein
MSKRKKRETEKWIAAEKAKAEQSVEDSERQLADATGLAQKSDAIHRRFGFIRQRNMFAEGFRAILREARP